MKIYQVVSAVNKESGGPSYTVPALCEQLHNLGNQVELNVLGTVDQSEFLYKVKAHKRLPPYKIGRSPELKKYLLSSVNENDILHGHGLWMMPNIYPYDVAKKTGAKLVVSPRGMLAAWSLNQNNTIKKIVAMMGQNRAILNADCLHVTAESEYDDVRSYGYTGPVSIIPNGVDIPEQFSKQMPIDNKRKIIFISRVHPKKGIELLLKAWGNIASSFEGWELIICGPGDSDYIDRIRLLINELPTDRVKYIPPVYGQDKDNFYKEAGLFVLPTYSENFGVVVAESLSYQVPAIVSKGAPWQGLVDNECGWWIENDINLLERTLVNALSLNGEELLRMGVNGREWMIRDFSWNQIGINMDLTYKWLCGKADKPDFVIID